jgi:hypothetical protein
MNGLGRIAPGRSQHPVAGAAFSEDETVAEIVEACFQSLIRVFIRRQVTARWGSGRTRPNWRPRFDSRGAGE